MKILIFETNGMKCAICGVRVPFDQYGLVCPCCFAQEIAVVNALRLCSMGLVRFSAFMSFYFEKETPND